MGLLIKVDGTEIECKPANGEEFTLEELQRSVGGYIEMVRLSDGRLMWVDEEGKLKGKEVNVKATKIAKVLPYDVVVGDVLITDPGEVS